MIPLKRVKEVFELSFRRKTEKKDVLVLFKDRKLDRGLSGDLFDI
jgi:hypothetical protein